MPTVVSPKLPGSIDPTALATLRETDLIPGKNVFVKTTGSDGNSGASWDDAFATIQAAFDASSPFDRLLVAPGNYVESVDVPLAKTNRTLLGMGGGRSPGVAIVPSAANATPFTNHADDTAVVNIDFATNGTGTALKNSGRRLYASKCKLEGDGNFGVASKALLLYAASVAAKGVTDQNGSDTLFEECEFAWSANGVVLQGSNYGAVTENRFRRCTFHNLPTSHFEEANSGGDAQHQFAGLEVTECSFQQDEAGADPTKYIVLDDDNANKGIVQGCYFPVALNGGKNLVSTGLKWVANKHTGGISTGQPS